MIFYDNHCAYLKHGYFEYENMYDAVMINHTSFLCRWSLQLILQGEWPGLAQIVKTRLGVTLQRCSRVAVLQPLCRTLLPLVSDPWGHTTKTIFSDSEISDEEGIFSFILMLSIFT